MTRANRLHIRVRLYCGDEIAMGPGKADLLAAITAHGSISAAARALDMSYRRAWLLVDTMNRCWNEPLVATTPGSAHGGGARVTPLGENLLAEYRALQARLDIAGGDADGGAVDGGADTATLFAALRPAPKESQKA